MTDKELMQKVHSGDKEAMGIVIERYYSDIYRFCLYMIRKENDAYDLTQEVFLKFIKYGICYRHNNLKGYLLTIARNVCFNATLLCVRVNNLLDDKPFHSRCNTDKVYDDSNAFQ